MANIKKHQGLDFRSQIEKKYLSDVVRSTNRKRLQFLSFGGSSSMVVVSIRLMVLIGLSLINDKCLAFGEEKSVPVVFDKSNINREAKSDLVNPLARDLSEKDLPKSTGTQPSSETESVSEVKVRNSVKKETSKKAFDAMSHSDLSPEERTVRYKDHYRDYFKTDNDLMSKITNNFGDGYAGLYGTRNFRVVLHGILYRGGANNYYHRENPRGNENPLPSDGLQNLCLEGFGKAIYLYNVNFTPAQLQCQDRFGATNQLTYIQRSALGGWEIKKDILASIYRCTQGEGSCPIYIHCWNGWHASGFIAALALRQFCGFTGEEAVKYWVDGTDSVGNSNLPLIKKQIQEFSPYSEFQISDDIRERICPKNPYHQ